MRQWDLSLTPSSDCSHSPELLPHQDDLIARMKEAISDQARESFTPVLCCFARHPLGAPTLSLRFGNQLHPRTQPQEARIEELGPADGIARSLYEMEIERVNFQLRSYLRTRLEKISRMVRRRVLAHYFLGRVMSRRFIPARTACLGPGSRGLKMLPRCLLGHLDSPACRG